MKTIYTLLFLALFLNPVINNAQTLKVVATRFIGGDGTCYADASQGDAVNSADGGIVFAGLTKCWDGEWEIPPSWQDFSAPSGNVIVGKLNADLNIQWIHVYGGSDYDGARGIVALPDGGYAVLSTTESNDHDVSGSHGTEDLWLMRLDANGNLLWQKCYGSYYDEQAISIALTPDNGFIMLGVSNGMGGDVPTHYSGSEFDYDWFVVKTDDTGGVQWTKSIGGLGDEAFSGKILSANGGYYLVSSSNSHDHDCIDTGWHPGLAYSGDDYYVFRLDYSGNTIWCKSYGGALSERAWNAIWDERDESINIVGRSTSHDYMVTGSIGDADIWTVKVSKDGVFKWGKCLGSVNYDRGCGICTMPAGYCISGVTQGGIIGLEDNWLFAMDMAGNVVADKQFGGLNPEFPSTAVTFNDGVAIIGGSNSTGFTEGQNLGHLSDNMVDGFISKVVFWALGITDAKPGEAQLAIMPNPSFGEVTHVKIPGPQVGTLCIYDVLGNTLYTVDNEDGKTDIAIDLSMWAKGLYVASYRVKDGNRWIAKIVNN